MPRTLAVTTAVTTAVAAAALLSACASTPPSGPMSFFVTSAGLGNGADLGGLAGADAHCQKLAAAAGAGSRTWRAYLSLPGVGATPTAPAVPQLDARSRIGNGPWFNARGELVAASVADLHEGDNKLTKATAIDERGAGVNGVGDQPNQHDILTGSRPDGTAFSPRGDTTCRAWTSSSDEAGHTAAVGHSDRRGLVDAPWARSWNFAHPTAGCSQRALVSTGGAGRFYCFASN